MTLQACPECAGQVSTEAMRCPHCGYPVGSGRFLRRLAVILPVTALAAALGWWLANR
jgi:RNA polymerase subunit RPABC4/transcription elongation factor Spt4